MKRNKNSTRRVPVDVALAQNVTTDDAERLVKDLRSKAKREDKTLEELIDEAVQRFIDKKDSKLRKIGIYPHPQ